ncbi:MAG TPA: hypothetical protein VIG07_16270 [Methylomirabilota bacterium]
MPTKRWTRVEYDRLIEKGSPYARAGLADYWIVNLVDRVLEVYREPAADAGAPAYLNRSAVVPR